MANSLQPWIARYLIEQAESHGADIAAIPIFTKNKKVQVTEFLTADQVVWARVSDKQHLILAKFTKDAVDTFAANHPTPLSDQKGAIVKISRFKPIFARYPLDNNRFSSASALILECAQVASLGPPGSAQFGNPLPISTNPDLKLWQEGLDKDGGQGNVLKQRKGEAEASSRPEFKLPPMPSPVPPKPSIQVSIRKHSKPTDEESYRAAWSFLDRHASLFRAPPEERITEMTSSEVQARFGTQTASQDETAGEGSMLGLPTPTPGQRPPAERMSSPFALGNESILEAEDEPQEMARKVPRPGQPSGVGVLAADSETSGSQTVLLGGLWKRAPDKQRPWMSVGEVREILEGVYEIRLRNEG